MPLKQFFNKDVVVSNGKLGSERAREGEQEKESKRRRAREREQERERERKSKRLIKKQKVSKGE